VRKPLELTFECPDCLAVGSVEAVGPGGTASCRACGCARDLRAESLDAEGLRACPLCATEDLYVQNDFPQGLGLAVVIAGFVVSTAFWYYDRPLPALGVLLASALADMALFYLVPDVTICYRCLSQYRGEGANPGGIRFKPFDLAVGERYRQERLRVEQLRAKPRSADPTSP
jgi:hypothetical protein